MKTTQQTLGASPGVCVCVSEDGQTVTLLKRPEKMQHGREAAQILVLLLERSRIVSKVIRRVDNFHGSVSNKIRAAKMFLIKL